LKEHIASLVFPKDLERRINRRENVGYTQLMREQPINVNNCMFNMAGFCYDWLTMSGEMRMDWGLAPSDLPRRFAPCITRETDHIAVAIRASMGRA
jgi:hypothetical protein